MIPKEIYQAFVERGTDWADKHGAAELLDGSLKSLRAQYALEAKLSEGCSMGQAVEIALTRGDYRDAMESAIKARIEANKAKVRYDATKALFEAKRTAEASERAAMRSAT